MHIVAPPSLQEIFVRIDLGRLLPQVDTPEFQAIISRANEKYFHWDDFRYLQPMPEGFSNEELWALLKVARTANRRTVVFSDKNGKPFSYWIPDSVLRHLNQIDLFSGKTIITQHPGSLPSKEQYVVSSLMEEAIASSQLEGAATTRKEAKEMLRSGRQPKNHHERMILNNWRAITYIRENRGKEITLERIFQLHRLVTTDTLDPSESGQLRTTDDINVVYKDEIVHTPPKADTLKKRMDQFCEFANKDDPNNWIHPVIKGAMLHFWLAYDHPFTDGNGRTARALLYWYVLSRGYSLFEFLAISRCFVRSPGQYVRAYLHTETDDGDLTYFLMYNLRAIKQAIREVENYIQKKQKEIITSNDLLRKYRGLNSREKTLIFHAIRHPEEIYTIEKHKTYHQIVYETARKDLLHLVKKGFLIREKFGHEYVFMAAGPLIEKLRIGETKKS